MSYAEDAGELATNAEKAARDEELKTWRAVLTSFWWPKVCERLKREEQERDRRLRRADGSDVAYENRLRGAADALSWLQNFMQQELDAATREAAEAAEEAKLAVEAQFYAEHGRRSPYDPPDNPV